MKKQLLFLFLATVVISLAQAQTPEATVYQSGRRPLTYAKGADSYIFNRDTYNPDKKYTVLKLYNAENLPTETETKEFDNLKKILAKKNIEVAEYKWTSEEDLHSFMAKYGIEASIKEKSCITIKSGNSSMNTTAGKVIFIVEDGKANSLCSGAKCEYNVKQYFGLISTD